MVDPTTSRFTDDRIDERFRRTDDVTGITVEQTDPAVLTVESDSGSAYTVVPNVAHCECPDHEHRDLPCKHLLFVATTAGVPDEIRNALLDGMDAQAEDFDEHAARLRNEAEYNAEQADAWMDAVDEIRHRRPHPEAEHDNARSLSDPDESGDSSGISPGNGGLIAEIASTARRK